MLELFFFCTVLFNMGSIVISLTIGDKGVCYDVNRNPQCCFDHRLISGKCVGCTFGFMFKGGSCVPCDINWYGELCVHECTCLFHQRCDHVLGCVDDTTYTQTVLSQSTTHNTDKFKQTTGNLSEIVEESEITNPTPTEKRSEENYSQRTAPNPTPTTKNSDENYSQRTAPNPTPTTKNSDENYSQRTAPNPTPTTKNSDDNFTQTTAKSEIVEETEITNKTPTEKSSDVENYSQTTALNLSEESEITNPTTTTKGLLDREIVIYSLVIACIIVILGLSYLVQKYRKKTINDPRHNTVQRTHSNGRDSFVDSNSSIYDEIDETMLVENASINVLKNEISLNTDNTSYLYPIHQEDDKKSSSVSEKSVNNSYLSIHESDQNHNSDESDKNDDTTSYLHPYNTVDEDWKGKTQQYDEAHVSNKDTDDSSDSSTYMNNDGYINPYQPLNKEWKQTFHSYEVPVTVHHCQISSAVPSVLDNDLYENCNDGKRILICKDNDVAHTSEAVISTCKKQAMADNKSLNDDIKEISASIGHNFGISNELKNISTNDPSSTQKENAFVPLAESDIKVFDNNEDDLHYYNVMQNVKIHTVSSIHTDQNTNLHDYTDAKSQ